MKPKKVYKHIAVSPEIFKRFRELKKDSFDDDILKRLLDEKEDQMQ